MKKPQKAKAPASRTSNLAVRVSAELLEALSRAAAKEERSRSQMAEIFLRKCLKERGELRS
jgi:hypothetical protein